MKLTTEELQQFRTRVQENPDEAYQNMKARAAAETFVELTPAFEASPENSRLLAAYLEERGQEVTVGALTHAFEILVADGKITPLDVEMPAEETPAEPQSLSADDRDFALKVERMGSAEYKSKILNDPAFKARCDQVFAFQKPNVDFGPKAATPRQAAKPAAASSTPVDVEFADKVTLPPGPFLAWVDTLQSNVWRRLVNTNSLIAQKYNEILTPLT